MPNTGMVVIRNDNSSLLKVEADDKTVNVSSPPVVFKAILMPRTPSTAFQVTLDTSGKFTLALTWSSPATPQQQPYTQDVRGTPNQTIYIQGAHADVTTQPEH